MNLYRLHDNPEQLLYNNEDKAKIPYFALHRAMRLRRQHKDYKQYEKVIATDARSSFLYATKVLRGRFLLGEPVILKSGVINAMNYFGQRFEIDEEWPELAELILKDGSPKRARNYAESIDQRWPEAEDIIKQDKIEWQLYTKFLNYLSNRND